MERGQRAGIFKTGPLQFHRGGKEETKKEKDYYFCHHKAACARGHINAGPATSDTCTMDTNAFAVDRAAWA